MFPLKKINLEKEVVLPNKADKESVFIKDNIIEANKISTSYSLFALEVLSDKYYIEYEDILVILYLYELGLFELKINVLQKKINLKHLLSNDFIVMDYNCQGKELYKLTKKSFSIVKEFNELINNVGSFLTHNRKAELDLKNKVTSVLDSYFVK